VTANAQTEPGEPELRITHILDAPRASLRGVGQFRTPEALVRPQRLHRVGLRNGFRVVVAYRLGMRGVGNDYYSHGVHREIVCPSGSSGPAFWKVMETKR
jgi:hypothetical protein